MKEYAGDEIRKWYRDLLADITVNGVAVPVFNYPDYSETPPFICLVNQTQGDYETKDKKDFNVSMLVQIHTANTGGLLGDLQADRIANAVMLRIKGNYGSTENFEIVTTQYNANESFASIDSRRGFIIRQIAYTHFVSKKLNNS
jgi:hypothetical protein